MSKVSKKSILNESNSVNDTALFARVVLNDTVNQDILTDEQIVDVYYALMEQGRDGVYTDERVIPVEDEVYIDDDNSDDIMLRDYQGSAIRSSKKEYRMWRKICSMSWDKQYPSIICYLDGGDDSIGTMAIIQKTDMWELEFVIDEEENTEEPELALNCWDRLTDKEIKALLTDEELRNYDSLREQYADIVLSDMKKRKDDDFTHRPNLLESISEDGQHIDDELTEREIAISRIAIRGTITDNKSMSDEEVLKLIDNLDELEEQGEIDDWDAACIRCKKDQIILIQESEKELRLLPNQSVANCPEYPTMICKFKNGNKEIGEWALIQKDWEYRYRIGIWIGLSYADRSDPNAPSTFFVINEDEIKWFLTDEEKEALDSFTDEHGENVLNMITKYKDHTDSLGKKRKSLFEEYSTPISNNEEQNLIYCKMALLSWLPENCTDEQVKWLWANYEYFADDDDEELDETYNEALGIMGEDWRGLESYDVRCIDNRYEQLRLIKGSKKEVCLYSPNFAWRFEIDEYPSIVCHFPYGNEDVGNYAIIQRFEKWVIGVYEGTYEKDGDNGLTVDDYELSDSEIKAFLTEKEISDYMEYMEKYADVVMKNIQSNSKLDKEYEEGQSGMSSSMLESFIVEDEEVNSFTDDYADASDEMMVEVAEYTSDKKKNILSTIQNNPDSWELKTNYLVFHNSELSFDVYIIGDGKIFNVVKIDDGIVNAVFNGEFRASQLSSILNIPYSMIMDFFTHCNPSELVKKGNFVKNTWGQGGIIIYVSPMTIFNPYVIVGPVHQQIKMNDIVGYNPLNESEQELLSLKKKWQSNPKSFDKTEETVKLSDIEPTEKVDDDSAKVKDMVKDIKNDTHSWGNLEVLKHDGKLYLLDGHHRLAAYLKCDKDSEIVNVYTVKQLNESVEDIDDDDDILEEDLLVFPEELNQKLFDGEHLKPEVREKLLEIGKVFYETFDLPFDLIDMYFEGSMAQYNWVDLKDINGIPGLNYRSDIDLHLVLDYSKLDMPVELVEDYFKTKKTVFNEHHNISIMGFEVELGNEDVNNPLVAAGVYSLYKDEWVKRPEPITQEVEDIRDNPDFLEFRAIVINVLQSDDYDRAIDLWTKIRQMRKLSLKLDGEFGKGNLIFKALRQEGLLGAVKEFIRKKEDEYLSIGEDEPTEDNLVEIQEMLVGKETKNQQCSQYPVLFVNDSIGWKPEVSDSVPWLKWTSKSTQISYGIEFSGDGYDISITDAELDGSYIRIYQGLSLDDLRLLGISDSLLIIFAKLDLPMLPLEESVEGNSDDIEEEMEVSWYIREVGGTYKELVKTVKTEKQVLTNISTIRISEVWGCTTSKIDEEIKVSNHSEVQLNDYEPHDVGQYQYISLEDAIADMEAQGIPEDIKKEYLANITFRKDVDFYTQDVLE